MTTAVAIDTSIAIPLLVRSHAAHGSVAAWWSGRRIALAGQAHVETYAVLTRLPLDLRVAPEDAAILMAARFELPMLLAQETVLALPDVLSRSGIAGGASYDALIALAALEQGAILATRDARARATYERLGAQVEIPHAPGGP